jgi:hypothetical protein
MIAADAASGTEATPERSAPVKRSYDIVAFDLVRQFVERMVAGNPLGESVSGRSSNSVDWETLTASVSSSRSLEHAIGRAVVIADQMCRGVFDDTQPCVGPPSMETENPFFWFNVTEVVADFGDESRYRTKVAKKMARIFGARRASVSPAVSP